MELINLIAPVFAVILTGYVFSWTNLLGQDTSDALVQFAVYVLIPAIMFYLIGQEEFQNLLNYGFYLSYGGTLLLLFLLLFAGLKSFTGFETGSATVAAFAGVASNTALVALPVLHAIFGAKGALPAVLANLVVALLLLVMTTVLESTAGHKASAKTPIHKIFLNVLKNPIIAATLLGVAYSFTGIGFSDSVSDYLELLSQALAAVALFAIGFTTSVRTIIKTGPLILFLTLVKLIAAPGLVLLAAHLIGLDPLWTIAATVSAAVPTAKNIFLLAKHYDQEPKLAAHIVSATSFLSVGTLIMWLFVLHNLYPTAFQLN
ncbi:auxin efflux carrier [Ruegeria sp. THAF57]|uniref:AEC family transporter n=1 Tax=Ruegeria sp. THAF57 TaxID=2744555 RepID=UPI0015DF5442|nr:AEC family transporter [Ruegeria sp. THAF57]CAD0184122.1 auxin efflux carrier [Ruegeria sp. THAF57]